MTTSKGQRPAPTYDIVDDSGSLSGAAGSTVVMTAKEICERSGRKYSLISKRLGGPQYLRAWTRLTKSAEQGRRDGRRKMGRGMTSSFLVDADDASRKHAQEERVRKGNVSL